MIFPSVRLYDFFKITMPPIQDIRIQAAEGCENNMGISRYQKEPDKRAGISARSLIRLVISF